MISVVTTIQSPTRSMMALAERSKIIVIGDGDLMDNLKPARYDLRNTELFTLHDQRDMPFKLAKLLPVGSYARKNLGYLEAMRRGETLIYETDDDNAPLQSWSERDGVADAVPALGGEWINVYRAFTHEHIWPRGFPLELSMNGTIPLLQQPEKVGAPIQQGLANGSPDVDAVWRMTQEHANPFTFEQRSSVRVPVGSWCPFNSQSTWWFRRVFPLMYLPVNCSFRVTDIWRSFVAQRCLWEHGLGIVFHAPEVFQDRNEHDPHSDFVSEFPAYLNNARIARTLGRLPLVGDFAEDMMRCYQCLTEYGWIPPEELELVSAWLEDV